MKPGNKKHLKWMLKVGASRRELYWGAWQLFFSAYFGPCFFHPIIPRHPLLEAR